MKFAKSWFGSCNNNYQTFGQSFNLFWKLSTPKVGECADPSESYYNNHNSQYWILKVHQTYRIERQFSFFKS